MIATIDQLPAVLTSFAYREEYFPELQGMLATVRRHHPTWHLVTGRGPVSGFKGASLEVESPQGNSRWTLPVPFELDGSPNDWLRTVWMKAWWVDQVWRQFGSLGGNAIHRVIWLDADARLNGPLDVSLEPEKEVVAGVWGGAGGTPDDHILSGFLVLQGSKAGVVESIINQWSARCLAHICNPPPPSVPSGTWRWGGGDQEVLTLVLRSEIQRSQFTLCKLMDYDKYCGEADFETGLPKQGALIDQWMMNRRMRAPHKNWPPPEWARRRS
jgi:hypothetical protein